MSFFSEASLAMIPSGYKTSKVYSALPTSGDGDLTLSRSNDTATRVGPDGLIEKVRTNTLTRSQEFTNAASWDQNATNITITAGQTDPNGGALGFLVTSITANVNYFYQSSAGTKTFSIFAKAGTRNNFSIINGVYNNGGAFDLATQTATSAGQGSLAKIESVGGGWFRCSVFMSSASLMIVSNSNLAGTDNVIGDSLTYAFAQAETGDIATDYIATTTAAVSVGPVANVPRLDYLDSSSPRLLLEPQRQNLFLQSEAINNDAWNAARYTRTANQTASPSGYVDADQCTPTATTGTHEIFPAAGISFSATAYTMSLFAKYDGYNISLGVAGASINWTGCVFDLQNGIAKTPQSAGSQSVCTAKIEDYGSGWYRCSITFTPYTTPTFYPTFGAVNSANATLGAWGAQEFTADGTSGTYLWGAQLEEGAYGTSYINTLGAVVTRGVDAMSKSSYACGITTEATLFADFEYQKTDSGYSTQFLIYNPSAGDYIYLTVLNNIIRVIVLSGGVEQSNIALGSTTAGTRYKVAARFKTNDFALYVNGTLVGTDTSGTMPTFGTSGVTSYIGNDASSTEPAGYVNQYIAFPTALSNAQLAELTA